MNKTEIGEENLYFEMETKQANDAEVCGDVISESTVPATKQTSWGTQRNERKLPASTERAHSCQANILINQRLLCIITAVVAVSFLTAAATFILALTMMMSRNSSTAATDCATVQAPATATTNLAGELEEIKKNISYMVTESVLFVMDGVWVNMTATHEAFEKKLDTGFKLLIASTEALNNSDGELASIMNELRQNQNLTKKMSERLVVTVTQLQSGVQELKKASGNVSSRAGSLERGYAQMNSVLKTLQAVNAAQNTSHEDLHSLYKHLNDSLATVNETLNNKLSVMDGVWVNMTATHEAFEKKLDTGFKLLIASTEALNNSNGELTSITNELRQNQNLTNKMSERLAVNVTQLQSGVQELKKASGNVSRRAGSLERGYAQMNNVLKTLQAVNAGQNTSYKDLHSLYKHLNYSLATVIATLNDKRINVSKTQGPREPPGPSGYNGTQGPPGVAGPSGSPGSSGPGNLSLCSYKEVASTGVSPRAFATTDAIAIETKGKKFLGVNCGTNDALVISFTSSLAPDGRRSYRCSCKNTVSSGVPTMFCYIRYWECPT